jgi:hypothetical protein
MSFNLKYLFTTRYDLSPADKKTLQIYGSKPIQSIQIVRMPLDKNVGTALNILTIGTWEKAITSAGYDKIFHLYLQLNFADAPPLIFEKNETVRLRPVDISKDVNPTTESSTIESYGANTLTVSQLFQTTLGEMGRDQFYTYDAFSLNCQNFVKNVLGANKILTPRNERFIMQDVESIARNLPNYTKPLASRVTTLARKFREIFGRGLPNLN